MELGEIVSAWKRLRTTSSAEKSADLGAIAERYQELGRTGNRPLNRAELLVLSGTLRVPARRPKRSGRRVRSLVPLLRRSF